MIVWKKLLTLFINWPKTQTFRKINWVSLPIEDSQKAQCCLQMRLRKISLLSLVDITAPLE